jgi:hypothetical protein
MTFSRDPATCAFPPHPDLPGPGDADGEAPLPVPESALSRFRCWLRHAPAERAPVVAVPAVWTAAEILHAAGVPGVFPGAAALAAAGIAYGIGESHARGADEEHPRLRGAELAAATGVTGAWVTAATISGPLAGPDHLLSIAYALGAGGGYWWLRAHEAVRAARARRDAAARDAAQWAARRAWWHRLAPRLGLHGSHLLALDQTLLGDTMLIDTRGTGKRASQLAGRDLAERIGEIEMIPVGRIDVTTDRIPGRLRISIRRVDPWAQPVRHPATVADSPYAKYVPVPATIREPLVIGVDPETGRPLQVPLWDAKGGKVILIAGKKDAGKTVLLNDLTERVTACPDALPLQVNLSKVLEDEIWAPLAGASALNQAGRARRTLQFVCDVIVARSRSGRRTPVHQPTPAEPLIVLKIDEIDAVAALEDCRPLLAFIASKCRSEGVALVIAGQRATAKWTGGADLRANIDIAIWGKFGRAGEARHVAGQEIDLPDMGAYGEGASGVFGVTELGAGGGYAKGRTFYLHEIDDLERIVRERLADRRPYVLEPALAGLAGAWARITGTGGTDDDAGPVRPGGGPARGGTGEDEDGGPARAARYDADGTRASLAAARAAGTAPADIPPVPPGMEDHAAAVLAERRRQFMEQYTDVSLPEADQAALRAMLARPGGITTRTAAAVLPWSHRQIHRQLTRWRQEGTARLDGKGSGSRWHAAPPGTPPGPWLHAVPDPGEEATS